MKLLICIFFGHKWESCFEVIKDGYGKILPYNECKRCKLLGVRDD